MNLDLQSQIANLAQEISGQIHQLQLRNMQKAKEQQVLQDFRALANEEAKKQFAQQIARDALKTSQLGSADDPQYAIHFYQQAHSHGKDAEFMWRNFRSQAGGYKGSPIGPRGIAKAALNEASGVLGGFTVPPNIRADILSAALANSVFRRHGATSIPFAGLSMIIGGPDSTTGQSAGVAPYFGGMQYFWGADGAPRLESEPNFKAVELVKEELTGYALVSRPLFHDGAGFPAFIKLLIGHLIAWLEDWYFFQGNGAGQPQGVIGSPASIKVSRNTPNKFVLADAEAMIAKLPPGCYNRAIWALSTSALGSNGWSGMTGIIPNADMKLYGRPVVPTDALPALGTVGDVVLMDPSAYLIADHEEEGGSLEIAISEHIKLLTNQVVVRVLRRLDGRPWMDQPMTLGDGSTQASPFVVLN